MNSSKLILKYIIVISIIIILVSVSPISTALADTAGPNNPDSGSNDPGIGTEEWVTPENITSTGFPYATVTLYQDHVQSNYLEGTNYNFSIPPDAAITGIEVQINRMSESRNPNIVDNEVRLVKGGLIVGENRAMVDPWPTTFSVVTYGGPTDLWGLSWLPADINSPDFGVVLAANRDNNGRKSRQALVDSMQITVYYGKNSSTTIECGNGTPVVYGDSITCSATVTRVMGNQTPTGSVNWTSDSSGSFTPNPCTLVGADGVSTCTTSYTPNSVGDGTHEITASYAGDIFFAPSSTSVNVDVAQRPITVKADPKTKVFGQSDPGLTYQITEGNTVFGDTFTGNLTRVGGENAGQYAILQGNLALSVNYDLDYLGDFLTITKATPDCVVTGYTVEYDRQSHTATGSCTGVLGEGLTGLDLTHTTHTQVGVYTGDAWTFTDAAGNYNAANGSVNNEITKRMVTITADAIEKGYGQPDPVLTYQVTVGSLLAGDDFSGGLIRQPGEKPGTYPILQGSLALPNYYTITYVRANFTITGAIIILPAIYR